MSRVNRSRERRISGGVQQLPWAQPQLVRPPIEIISADEVEQIHRASLLLLSTTGMRVLHGPARQLLVDAGCVTVDDIVRFDPEMVEATIAAAPSSFTLHARNPQRSLTIGGNHVTFAAIGGPAFVHDLDRGRRAGTMAEQADYLRVIQMS